MTNRSGTFIVVEGIDGMGKSTQIARLAAYLEQRGHFVRRSREPTDSEYGCEIRRIAREGRDGVSLEQELDLFLKDREIDVRDNILPALEAGGIALVDRYFYSNIAYQGALGLDPERIRAANSPRFPTPDLMLLFDSQTSGGLLLCVPAEKRKAFEKRATQMEQAVWFVGRVVEGEGIKVA